MKGDTHDAGLVAVVAALLISGQEGVTVRTYPAYVEAAIELIDISERTLAEISKRKGT